MFYFRCIFYTFYTNTGKMITEIEKTQVRNKLLPHWLFYKVEHEVINFAYNKMVTDFKNVDEYESLIKQMIRISETIFIKQIAPLDRKDFITVLNDQYNNYNLKCLDMTDWLKTTYKLITEGLPNTQINLQSKSEFLDWYKEKIKSVTVEVTKQVESINTDEVKKELHTHIFKDNAFEFWVRLFENLNVNKTKRTDLRFMYEVMKHNGQIHETVNVKNITDWINETYDFNIDKLQYTSYKSKENKNRLSVYNLIK